MSNVYSYNSYVHNPYAYTNTTAFTAWIPNQQVYQQPVAEPEPTRRTLLRRPVEGTVCDYPEVARLLWSVDSVRAFIPV